jgi:hypothetical protein
MHHRLTLPALLAASLAAAPVALAQEEDLNPEGEQARQQEQTPAEGSNREAGPLKMNDRTLDRFAEAYVAIRRIQSDFADQLGEVEEREKARELQQEAQEKMVTAVEEAGLSVSEYNQVARRMQNDPELREKVEQRTRQ